MVFIQSRNNLSKIQVVNFDEYKSIRTLYIALYADTDNVTYFDKFGVRKEIFLSHKQQKYQNKRLQNASKWF